MLTEKSLWPLHEALAWVLTRDLRYVEKAKPDDFGPRLSLDDEYFSMDEADRAWRQLHKKMASNEIAFFGVIEGTVAAERIDPAGLKVSRWTPSLAGTDIEFIHGQEFQSVTVSRDDLLRCFPAEEDGFAEGSLDLGAPESVIGPGYMSLANAVYWIATEGGTRQFWLREYDVWEQAIAALVDAIANESVRLLGRPSTASLAQPIDGRTLSGIAIASPYSEKSLELMMGSEPYLDVTLPSLGDDWRSSTDQIHIGRSVKLSHLQVSREDIRQAWQFEREASKQALKPTAKRRASERAIRKSAEDFVKKTPNAGLREADGLAKEIGANRDLFRIEVNKARRSKGIVVRPGRPSKST